MKQSFLLAALFIFCFKIGYSQPGALDLSFGKKGVVRADLGTNISHASAAKQVLLPADGSIYVVFESAGLTFITKKHPDGSIDSTYGSDGFSAAVAITNTHAALQKDGKIVVAGEMAGEYGFSDSDYPGSANNDFAAARYNTDGSLDHTFDGDGKVTTDFTRHDDVVKSIIIQNDGKIVLVGYIPIYADSRSYDSTGENYYFHLLYNNIAISRYNTNGSLDETFNNGGRLYTQVRTSADCSAAKQTDGKIVVAATTDTGLNLARFNPNGSADNSFKNTSNLTRKDKSYFASSSISVQSDGKIVLGGFWKNSNSNKDFVLARFKTNGGLDSTFNKNGIQNTDFRTYDDIITSTAIQSDGKIVATGYASNGLNNAFAIARYNTNGSIDSTFDADGKKMTYIGSYNVYSLAAAIQNTGKIIAAGFNNPATSTNIAIAKYNTDGSLDNTFNRNGTLIDYFKQKNTAFTSSAAQKDGKIVAAGYAFNGTSYDFLVTRYNTDGSLDNSFSSDGIQTTGFTFPDFSKVTFAAIQANGKIVVAADSVIISYNTNGSADNAFGTNGKQKAGFEIASLGLQPDGKIVAAGGTTIARYNTNGSLDNSFNGNGSITAGFTVNAFAFQSDGKIVAGGDFEYQSVIARFNANGSADATFGMRGVPWVSSDYPTGEYLTAVRIQKDGKIVVAGYGGIEDRYYLAYNTLMARFNPDGSLDKSFSEDGIMQIFVSANSALISLQNDGKIVVSSNLYQNNQYGTNYVDQVSTGFGIARLNNNGTFDSTFGRYGKTYSEQDQIIHIQSLAVANNKLYATGYGQLIPAGANVRVLANYGFIARYLLTANTPPTVSLTAPGNHATYTAPAAIKLSAAANDSDGTISKVEFYKGTTLLHTETVAPYGYLWRNVPAGTYTLTAKATDNAGAQTTSAPVKVIVNTPPTVSLTAPANNAAYAAPATIKLSAAASDSDGTITKVEFYNGSTLLHTETVAPYGYLWRNVPAGTYTITAVAADNFGAKTTSATVTITVTSSNTMMVSNRPFAKSEKTALNDALRLGLYPNPATNVVHIYTKGLQQDKPTTISVISASGVIMKTMQLNSLIQTQLDISSLAKGVYTVKIVSGDKVMHKQFVKL